MRFRWTDSSWVERRKSDPAHIHENPYWQPSKVFHFLAYAPGNSLPSVSLPCQESDWSYCDDDRWLRPGITCSVFFYDSHCDNDQTTFLLLYIKKVFLINVVGFRFPSLPTLRHLGFLETKTMNDGITWVSSTGVSESVPYCQYLFRELPYLAKCS